MHRGGQQTKTDIDPENSRGSFCQFIYKEKLLKLSKPAQNRYKVVIESY